MEDLERTKKTNKMQNSNWKSVDLRAVGSAIVETPSLQTGAALTGSLRAVWKCHRVLELFGSDARLRA